jgi:hypothetical protein
MVIWYIFPVLVCSGKPSFGCEASFCVETRQEKGPKQGCQIFLDTINQNGEKYTKLPQHYLMVIKYILDGCKIFQMTVKCTNSLYSKALQNLPKFGFWFENVPSGIPGPKMGIFFAACYSFRISAQTQIRSDMEIDKMKESISETFRSQSFPGMPDFS